MGWPLAVSAGLMERSSRALVAALWPLTVGHLLAMFVVILPFSLLIALVQWQRQLQIGASLLTRAPSAATKRASAAPCPRAPPLMSMTFPLRRSIFALHCL